MPATKIVINFKSLKSVFSNKFEQSLMNFYQKPAHLTLPTIESDLKYEIYIKKVPTLSFLFKIDFYFSVIASRVI